MPHSLGPVGAECTIGPSCSWPEYSDSDVQHSRTTSTCDQWMDNSEDDYLRDYKSFDCFNYNSHVLVNSNSYKYNDQRQSMDWYWSYIEGTYKCIHKFSSVEHKNIYLYPLIFPMSMTFSNI